MKRGGKMIEIGRNSIVVRDVDLESQEFKNINYNYSLYDRVLHKYTFSAFTIIDKDMYFPASISVEEIKKYFKNMDFVYNYKTTAKSSSISYNMKHPPRDELQKKAINFLMTMKDDDKVRERFLSLATGSGKTYVTINIISKYKKKPLIIVDTLDLAAQWKREFQNHSDLKEDEIVILSGAESVENEIKDKNGKVYIAIHRTLGNMMTEDYNSINLLMNKLKIGIRVFDEAHVNFKNVCMLNALSNVEYTIFLTATPSRSNFTDDHLYGKIFRRIPYFNGKDLTDEKYHTVVLYSMDSKPSFDEKLSVKTKYGFNSSRWASYIENGGYEIFWTTLTEIFDKFKLQERKMKIAIMLPTINLIKKAEQDLKGLNLDVGVFIGEIKKEKRILELDKDVILTNDKIFDKGIDVKDLEVLINFVPFASLVKTEQIIGRLRYGKDKASVLIDVTDYGFDECIKQFKIRKRFYKKKAKKIIEIERN
jgi:superfamily II DNA or RNA helicase